MSKLKQLIESALTKEDGTVADLGVIPTGHKRHKHDEHIVSVNEDTIAHFVNDKGETIAYNVDSDDEGLYIRRPSGITMRIRNDKLVIKSPEKGEEELNLVELKPWLKAVQYLLDNQKGMVK